MRWTFAVIMLLAMTALAGCSGDDDGGAGTTTSSSGSPTASHASSTSSASATSTSPPLPNQAPTGTVSVAINGTQATFNLTGSDADGDALSWNLTFGDGASTEGTELPASLDHTYAAGNFTATFQLTDGEDSGSYNVSILVAGEGAGATAVTHSGSVAAFDPFAAADIGCLMDAGRRDAGGPGGVTGQDHPIEEAQHGWTYVLDNTGMMAEYWSDEPAILGTGTSGEVPAGATYVVICVSDPTAAGGDYTLTLTP